MKRIAAALGALIAAFTIAIGAPASAEAQDNAVVVVNTHDGLDMFRAAFKIVRTTQDAVDQSNAAVAAASCTDCSTTAIALQIVLIFSDPSEVTSVNLALAFNELCSHCVTVAQAYQWVLTTGGVVRFTNEGNRRLAEIYRRIHQLRNAGLTIEQLQAELDAIAAEVKDILTTELVSVGGPSDAGTSATESTPEPTTEPTTTEATTTEPTTTDSTTTDSTTTEPTTTETTETTTTG